VLAEVGPQATPRSVELCDWLGSISLPDGGLPFALPETTLGEDLDQPSLRRNGDGKLVVAAPEILDEGMAGREEPRARLGLQTAHRSQPRLEPAVVGLEDVVGVLPHVVEGGGEQFVDTPR
jgi:hypothetical protein